MCIADKMTGSVGLYYNIFNFFNSIIFQFKQERALQMIYTI